MYWFLAICIWPFTRFFARVVKFFMNLLDREWWNTDHPTNTRPARFLRALTAPWPATSDVTVVVKFFVYLVFGLMACMIVITALHALYAMYGVAPPKWAHHVILSMVVIVLNWIVAKFAVEDNSPLRTSWRNRHRRVWFLKCDLPHLYQHHSGIFVGTRYEVYKFVEAGKEYYTHHEGTSCRAKWSYAGFSLPVSWMFGEKVWEYSSVKFRPTWRGQDTCYWVENKIGERILWDVNASPWGLFDSMMSDKLGILFALEEEKQRAYRRHARDFSYIASAFETSKKSEPSPMMKRLAKVCRDLAQHYITLAKKGIYDHPTPALDVLNTYEHTYGYADPDLFRQVDAPPPSPAVSEATLVAGFQGMVVLPEPEDN